MRMRTFVALLRAINVAGKNKISMAELRGLFEALGYGDVRTYVQSGNVVFTSSDEDVAAVARRIEDGITNHLGLRVTVLVRTPDDLAAIVRDNPFSSADLSRVHVTFLASEPAPERLEEMSAHAIGPDEFRFRHREIYLHTPDGYGRSKLNNAALERWLGVPATTRNWRTVTKLVELSTRQR